MSLIETFQNLAAEVPELLQPVVVAAAGAVPFIEGEGAATIGHSLSTLQWPATGPPPAQRPPTT